MKGLEIEFEMLSELAEKTFQQHRWAKVYREAPAGAELLLDHALDYLASLRLVLRRPEGVRPLPAIARYRVAAAEETARRTAGQALDLGWADD